MYPILYESNETSFSHNGIGVLTDCSECTVTEERNGIYECEFKYPITGQLFTETSVDRIIKVKANETSDLQLFRIYRNTKPINGVVKFYAQHISYDLNKNSVSPLHKSNVNATTALNALLANTFYEHPFTAVSTLSTISSLNVKVPVSARNCLGGMQGSILDNYGGEYEFDNFTIRLHANRGQDNGVRIAYGKNLTDIKSDTNIDGVYTSVYPYVIDAEENVHILPEKVIQIDTATSFGTARTLNLDLSEKFDDSSKITAEKIREYTNAYIKSNKIDQIKQNIEISFIQLWQSKEYDTLALLERVKLCDTVTVEHLNLGIDVKAKCIKTVYDSLNEKFIKIELGQAKSNFATTLSKVNTDLKTMSEYIRSQPSEMEKAIRHATELITGELGGYVIIRQDEETGYPTEILIMDNPDKEKAINVWRFNSGGLGHSSTGYNGPFADIALTKDGQINASMITVGILNADLIKSGTIQDAEQNMTINMNNGRISIKNDNSSKLIIWRDGLSMYNKNEKIALVLQLVNNEGYIATGHLSVGNQTFIKTDDDGKGLLRTDKIRADDSISTSSILTNSIIAANTISASGFIINGREISYSNGVLDTNATVKANRLQIGTKAVELSSDTDGVIQADSFNAKNLYINGKKVRPFTAYVQNADTGNMEVVTLYGI